jgi:signal transduction histidine kinase
MCRTSELETTDSQHRRLALNMRDHLAQNLVALKLDITMLHTRSSAAHPLLHERTAQALATLDDCINNVRDLINELHPLTLELGLRAAVEWQLQQIERRQGLPCKLSVLDDNAALTPQQTSTLFHIVQTGLAYLSTCAQLLQVELKLSSACLTISLSVVHQPGASCPAEVTAINAMRQRLVLLGGTLHVAQHALLISVPDAP